jgi:DNA-binding NarL/FixJ family response regulator
VTLPDGAEGTVAGPVVVLVDVRPERRGPMLSVIEAAMGSGTVAQVGSAAEALAAVARHEAIAAVVEVQLPLAAGLAVIAALRSAHPSLVIVVCTFHHDPATRQQAEGAGADAYLVKPVSAREMRSALNSGRRAPLADIAVRS